MEPRLAVPEVGAPPSARHSRGTNAAKPTNTAEMVAFALDAHTLYMCIDKAVGCTSCAAQTVSALVMLLADLLS